MRPYALATLLIPCPSPPTHLTCHRCAVSDAAGPGGPCRWFRPQGWTLESSVEGDLDQDGRADLVLVLRQQEPRNIIEHDGFGPSPYDSNPRILAVAWSRPLRAGGAGPPADTASRQSGDERPARRRRRQHPARHPEGRTVFIRQRGKLVNGHDRFTFRWQDDAFALIGYDQNSVMRNSGQTESVSVNFSTRRVKRSEGSIEDDKDSVRWEPLRSRRHWTLQTVGDGWAFDPLAGSD